MPRAALAEWLSLDYAAFHRLRKSGALEAVKVVAGRSCRWMVKAPESWDLERLAAGEVPEDLPLFTLRDACEFLGFKGGGALRKAIKDGRLKPWAHPDGRSVRPYRFSIASLRCFVAANVLWGDPWQTVRFRAQAKLLRAVVQQIPPGPFLRKGMYRKAKHDAEARPRSRGPLWWLKPMVDIARWQERARKQAARYLGRHTGIPERALIESSRVLQPQLASRGAGEAFLKQQRGLKNNSCK